MHPRLIQFGSIAIPTTGVVTAIAIVAALFIARATARYLALDSERVWDLGIAGVLTALVAPRLVLIATNWRDFHAHPLWMIGLVSVHSPTAVAGGMALALLVIVLYLRFARLPFRRTLDALAPAFALGSSIYWIGAFLAGANFGAPATVPWSVTSTSRLASLWYRTPLGAPLHPVQLYAAAIDLCLFALSMAMIATPRRRFRDGEIMGSWLFLHGLAGFFLNFLRGDLAPSANSFPLAESLAATMVFTGGLLWLL